MANAGVEGVSPVTASCTFTDANPGATSADFTIINGGLTLIIWGDGTTTIGTVSGPTGGSFTVTGSHQYTEEGTCPAQVQVFDDGGAATFCKGPAIVADAPLTAGPLALPSTTFLGSPTAATFTFSDANPGARTADYTSVASGGNGGSATVNWGDGTTSTGTVSGPTGGLFTVTGSHTYAAICAYTVTVKVTDDGGATTSATGTTYAVIACPASGKVNTRWHYSANGSSGSWSGTTSTSCTNGSVKIGPQAMEGDLKVNPGTTLKAGYDFTLPGNHNAYTALVVNPQVVFQADCVSGAPASPATFSVAMANQMYQVTDDSWYPSGDQSSSLVYQGSTSVPNVCSGGQVRLDKGGTFSATIVLY